MDYDGATATPAATGVLDDFDRNDGAIGANWSGDTGHYSIANNRLVAGGQDTAIFWNPAAFAANQKVIE